MDLKHGFLGAGGSLLVLGICLGAGVHDVETSRSALLVVAPCLLVLPSVGRFVQSTHRYFRGETLFVRSLSIGLVLVFFYGLEATVILTALKGNPSPATLAELTSVTIAVAIVSALSR